jgi:hypothetical protein
LSSAYLQNAPNLLFYYKHLSIEGKDCSMKATSGTVYAMQQRIMDKLRATGAISREKAATAQEAHLDIQEQNWLYYVAGGLNSKVKKTKDRRYYVPTYH